MLWTAWPLPQVQKRNKRFLQNILGFTVTQPERAPIKDQLGRFLLVKRLAPVGLWFRVQFPANYLDRHLAPGFCIKFFLGSRTAEVNLTFAGYFETVVARAKRSKSALPN